MTLTGEARDSGTGDQTIPSTTEMPLRCICQHAISTVKHARIIVGLDGVRRGSMEGSVEDWYWIRWACPCNVLAC